MTDSGDLERRYRRLLHCYPRAFRRLHEDEILAVLLDGARGSALGNGMRLRRLRSSR